ncbi:MAG: hypothetical protein KKH41_07985 [Candidatus Thermoplasmatota archaeon]|nr:hypothetical protein [Euryarchaeota archaeon]MBU4032027.1 hypothetical protein [Candidatus Thermoplasmatota archaeon]MBU4071624.1 hypothetical protein [Candidatus Thermoplasmatota archaeon]MBU4143884.1 hypothetical protein [Candidatus Thermoplasmatota archaeon]MBU4592507.1 hypothetical protein [Candidatus Thermoplasmatota archaeon]
MVEKKKIDKRMEAKTVVQLKHMFDMELRRIKDDNNIDIIMFVGIDGRIFASLIPTILDSVQFRFLNLLKGNLPSLCSQLKGDKLKVSIQQYELGTVVISGIGANCFLASIFSKPLSIDTMGPTINNLVNGSTVLNHLFEQRSIAPEDLVDYDPAVAEELGKLTRQLFVETFEETRGYKRNMELLKFLRQKIGGVVGIGAVDEIITVTMNELGTSTAFMKDADWLKLVERVIENHIRERSGELVADQCRKTWVPEVERKLKSFV